MSGDIAVFAVLGLLLILGTLSALLGPDRLAKFLFANCLFLLFTCSLYGAMDHFAVRLRSSSGLDAEQTTARQTIATVITTSQKTVVLVIYCLLLYLLFTRVGDFVRVPRGGLHTVILHVLLVPLGILGLFLSIVVMLFGTVIFSATAFPPLLQSLAISGRVYTFFSTIPFFLFLYVSAALLLLYHFFAVSHVPSFDFDGGGEDE